MTGTGIELEGHGIRASAVYAAFYPEVAQSEVNKRVRISKVQLPTVAGLKYVQSVADLTALLSSFRCSKGTTREAFQALKRRVTDTCCPLLAEYARRAPLPSSSQASYGKVATAHAQAVPQVPALTGLQEQVQHVPVRPQALAQAGEAAVAEASGAASVADGSFAARLRDQLAAEPARVNKRRKGKRFKARTVGTVCRCAGRAGRTTMRVTSCNTYLPLAGVRKEVEFSTDFLAEVPPVWPAVPPAPVVRGAVRTVPVPHRAKLRKRQQPQDAAGMCKACMLKADMLVNSTSC
jgi:hypothetical protein